MTGFWIDTERARRVAAAWADRADAWFGIGVSLADELGRLALRSSTADAPHQLTAASTESWVTASFLRLVVDAVESSDHADGFGPAAVARWHREAGARALGGRPGACAPTWAEFSFSPHSGDLGQTGDAEVRSPYSITGATPSEAGRNLIARALTDLDDPLQIRPDEFQLVHLAGGRYVVVLPGVTDLSRPDPGLSGRHRSVRDVDRYAVASSRSTAVGDNRYARMVRDAVVAAGVPRRAELMIVGHSFGADTALDLAADPAFNGPDGYTVTHVVAAGYHSMPQLPEVVPATEVLVLQNLRDVAVLAERVGYGHLTDAADHAAAALDDAIHLDRVGAVGHAAGAAAHGVGALIGGVRSIVTRPAAVATMVTGAATARPTMVADGLAGVVAGDPGIRRPGADDAGPDAGPDVVDVFVGGGDGLGHAPANYRAHVESVTDPLVTAFFESVAAAGYATDGTAWAIDVSVPGDPI